MFPVFNRICSLLWVGFFLFPLFKSTASLAGAVDDPMEQFHQEERPSTIENQYLLESSEKPLRVKVYVINQDEPYDSPFTFRVFIQCLEGGIAKLERLKGGGSEKTYCQTGLPEILREPEFFGDDREYLALSAHSFDSNRGLCNEQNETLEVYPVEDLNVPCEK